MLIAYAEEHGNRAAERHFNPPPTEKNYLRLIGYFFNSKEYLGGKKKE